MRTAGLLGSQPHGLILGLITNVCGNYIAIATPLTIFQSNDSHMLRRWEKLWGPEARVRGLHSDPWVARSKCPANTLWLGNVLFSQSDIGGPPWVLGPQMTYTYGPSQGKKANSHTSTAVGRFASSVFVKITGHLNEFNHFKNQFADANAATVEHSWHSFPCSWN